MFLSGGILMLLRCSGGTVTCLHAQAACICAIATQSAALIFTCSCYCEAPTCILISASFVQDMLGIRGNFMLAASAVKVCSEMFEVVCLL